MKQTAKAVLFATFAAALIAQEGKEAKKATDKSVPLTDSQLLRIENISLKQALAEQQAKAIASEQNLLVKDICTAAKIDVQVCSIDVQNKVVLQKDPAAPAKK